jgi:hypothetical protein
VVRTILVTSLTASGAGGPTCRIAYAKILLLECRSIICDQFNNRRIYRSLRLLATLPRVSDSEREVTSVKLRAIITAMLIALATPAFADISDYESMHRRLADVLGSRAQADAAYDKLMQEASLSTRWWICSSNCARQAMNVTRNPSGYGSGKAASDRFANSKKAGLHSSKP